MTRLLAMLWLVCGWAPASALEIVSARGAAVLGRPLDVHVSIRLDKPDEDPCAEAQVFLGENRPSAMTQWTVPPGAGSGTLRVTTQQTVDEPIVTLYATVGCQQKVSRKFVLFAELETQAGASVQLPRVLAASVPGTSSAVSGAAATAVSDLRADMRLQGSAQQARLPSRPPVKARLKLEAIDLPLAQSGLRPTLDLNLRDGVDAKTRETAVALWRAINATPEDVLRDAQRIKTLEGQFGQMQSKLAAQQETLQRMQTDVERQHSYLLALLVLMVLGVGAYAWSRKAALSGRGLPWWKENKPAWFKEPVSLGRKSLRTVPTDEDEPSQVASFGSFFNRQGATVKARSVDAPASVDTPAAPVAGKGHAQDLELDFMHTAKLASPDPVLHVKSAATDAPASVPLPILEMPAVPVGASAQTPGQMPEKQSPDQEGAGQDPASAFESFFGVELTGKNYDVQELFDVQEQSEFFITVGQFDQAIEVLTNHIEANPEGSPLAYLDLFALFHRLGKRSEYEELAQRFVGHFNARIPPFDEYGSEKSRSLEHYTAAITRIQLLWPTEKTLNAIAESIFRKPDSPETAFTLDAYQDLLLLYGMLKDIHDNEKNTPDFVASGFMDSGFGATGFQATRMEALPTVETPAVADDYWAGVETNTRESAVQESMLEFDVYTPPKSSRLGIDIDLTAPESIGEGKSKPRTGRSRR